MATKKELALAYDAGRHVLLEPPDRRSVDACPFEPGTEEAAEWLRGFADALDDTPDPATLKKELKDAMKAGDNVG